MLDGIVNFDRAATLAVNGWNSPAGDSFWLFMSSSKQCIPFYIAAFALIIWRLGWKRGLLMILAIGLSVGACDQFCNLVKDSVCRLRPCMDKDMLANGLHVLQSCRPDHCYGFFSAHAATSFALAAGSCYTLSWAHTLRRDSESRQGTWKALLTVFHVVFYAWALLVSLSRVFVGKHFLGDITVGAVAGLIIAFTICTAFKWIAVKFKI